MNADYRDENDGFVRITSLSLIRFYKAYCCLTVGASRRSIVFLGLIQNLIFAVVSRTICDLNH